MRMFFLFMALLASRAAAQPVLYAGAGFTREYVVGAKLPDSGLFQRDATGAWKHIGYRHPFLFSFAADPRTPSRVYVAAGNGLLRVGPGWTQLTGSDITELRDVTVDPRRPSTIYFGYVHGIRVTHDAGTTWNEIGANLPQRFTETVRLNPKDGSLLAGTSAGLYRTADEGRTWQLAGAAGVQITRLEVSPHDPCSWLATTQQAGLFASRDCGVSFENEGRLGVGLNLYDIAFDPSNARRIAVAGWNLGVAISDDGGQTWQSRNIGLPSLAVTTLTFDPTAPGRLFVGVHEEGVYVSADNGRAWRKEGLDGAQITRLRFLPESRP